MTQSQIKHKPFILALTFKQRAASPLHYHIPTDKWSADLWSPTGWLTACQSNIKGATRERESGRVMSTTDESLMKPFRSRSWQTDSETKTSQMKGLLHFDCCERQLNWKRAIFYVLDSNKVRRIGRLCRTVPSGFIWLHTHTEMRGRGKWAVVIWGWEGPCCCPYILLKVADSLESLLHSSTSSLLLCCHLTLHV